MNRLLKIFFMVAAMGPTVSSFGAGSPNKEFVLDLDAPTGKEALRWMQIDPDKSFLGASRHIGIIRMACVNAEVKFGSRDPNEAASYKENLAALLKGMMPISVRREKESALHKQFWNSSAKN